MSARIHPPWKRKKDNRYFRKIIGGILWLAVTLTVLLSALSYINLSVALELALKRSEQSQLQSFIGNAEQLLKQVSSASKYLPYNPSIVSYERYSLANPGSDLPGMPDASKLLLKKNVIHAMRIECIINPYISDVYYYDNEDTIITSSGSAYSIREFYDTQWLDTLRSASAFPVRVDTHFISEGDGETRRPVIKYIYRPYGTGSVFVYNIDVSRLYAMVSDAAQAATSLYMVDAKGNILMCGDESLLLTNIHSILPGLRLEEEPYSSPRGQDRTMVSVSRSDSLGWYFVGMTDVSEYHDQLARSALILFVICLVSLLSCSIAAVAISRRLYVPVKSLLQMTQQGAADHNDQSQDEFGIIETGILRITEEKRRFEARFHENTRTFATLFWVDLLQNQGMTEAEISSKTKSLGIRIPPAEFFVLIINPREWYVEDFRERQLLNFRISQTLSSILQDSAEWTEVQADGNLVFVCYSSDCNGTLSRIDARTEELEEAGGQRLMLTASIPLRGAERIAEGYSMAKTGLRYRAIWQGRGVLRWDALETLKAGGYSYPYDAEKALKVQIIAGNAEGARKVLGEILSRICTGYQSAAQLSAGRLLSVLLELLSVTADRVTEEELAGGLQLFDSMSPGRLEDFFGELVERALRHYQGTADGSRALQRLLRVLDAGYTRDISCEEAAQAAKLSPAAVSPMLKEATGLSFMEYITRRRMRYAEELLADPTLTVSAVAGMVGYNDANYFIRIFKKNYGCTPNKYRNILRNTE